MNGYRIKIEVVAVSIEHAVRLAQQATKYLPDSWNVSGAIGNVDVTVEPCKIGEREEDEVAT